MSTEAMMWLGLILISPAFQILGRIAGRIIMEIIQPGDKIVVTYTDDNGKKYSESLNIADDDNLKMIVDDIRRSRSGSKGVVR